MSQYIIGIACLVFIGLVCALVLVVAKRKTSKAPLAGLERFTHQEDMSRPTQALAESIVSATVKATLEGKNVTGIHITDSDGVIRDFYLDWNSTTRAGTELHEALEFASEMVELKHLFECPAANENLQFEMRRCVCGQERKYKLWCRTLESFGLG